MCKQKKYDDSYETLYELYVNQGKNILEMAKILNGGAVNIRKKLHEYGIPLRNKTLPMVIPCSKEELFNLYVNELKSCLDISKIYNVSSATVKKWCKHYEIPLRDHKETISLAMKPFIHSKEDFINRCNQVHDNKYDYSNIDYKRVAHPDKIEIICPEHGSFLQLPNHHLNNGFGCPSCGHIISNSENEICQFLKDNDIEYIQSYRDGLNGNYEIDIYIPQYKLGIEFNGVFWHSERFKSSSYHLKKTEWAENNDIHLLHIFENEWKYKKDIWKSLILYKCNKIHNRIYARKCIVKTVNKDEEKQFLENNHLQGFVSSYLCVGLYYKDELVSLLSIGKSRYNKVYEWEIIRFCNKINTSVIGGATKLFKQFKFSSVISYSDRRYSQGNLYKALGMKYSHSTRPSYYYFHTSDKNLKLYNRVGFQKHRLKDKLKVFNTNLSEYENMKLNGYERIWDCGNTVWVLDGIQ